MRTEFTGTILEIRAMEDCVRTTKKYTKGAFSRPAQHPIQGDDFPSKVITEYYEVYPDMEVGMDMSIIDFALWLADETPHIDVRFNYNYQRNRAMMIVFGGNDAMRALTDGIPGLRDVLPKAGIDDTATAGRQLHALKPAPPITIIGRR
jgi:hypothetical protein